MLIIFSARKKIKDRHIGWKETYKEKSVGMKKRFEKILPGSYFRWEGHDYESGHPYYVVVGPSDSKRYGKSFFAGVKRMPKDPKKKVYAPTGKYFPSLMGALSHANNKWGTPIPRNAGKYKKQDLTNIKIPKHIK